MKGEVPVDRLAIFQHEVENIFRTGSVVLAELANRLHDAPDEFRLGNQRALPHFARCQPPNMNSVKSKIITAVLKNNCCNFSSRLKFEQRWPFV